MSSMLISIWNYQTCYDVQIYYDILLCCILEMKIETKIELRISKELCKIQNHYIYKACVKCGRGCYNVPDGIFFLIERITK